MPKPAGQAGEPDILQENTPIEIFLFKVFIFKQKITVFYRRFADVFQTLQGL
ncbi:hypothetical protein l11_14300 [Neisseria weaveri LMG 5135]|nr:hypothetical protein l11_14300 [Neisseria weaveri LMG 5135]